MRVVVLSLALLFTACALTTGEPRRSQPAVRDNKLEGHARVTLDVFSGRKNPSWSLSKEQAESLLSIVRGLPASEPGDFFDGLGYRGFRVSMPRPGKGGGGELTVYRGRVRYDDGRNVKHLTDKERRLEQLLLKSGSPYLTPGLYKAIEREVQPPGK